MTTVLVVDDRPVNRDLVCALLGYRGLRTLEADGGAEALELICRDRPDLVITDVVMPGMDGYELVREIRADPATAAIPVVFYTATYLAEEVRPVAEACGVRHIVAKTGDPSALLTAVDAALAETRPPAGPVAAEQFGQTHQRVVNAKLIEKIRELEEKDRLNQLVDAVIAVGCDLSLPATLRRIVTATRPLLNARYAALGVIGGPDRQLIEFIHAGIDEDTAERIGRLPSGRGILGLPIRQPQPLRLTDLGAHAASVGFPQHHPPMRSFLGVPIRIHDEVLGNLYLTEKGGGGDFSIEDERLATALATAAAVAISNARNYNDAQRRKAWLTASADITATLLAADPADTLQLVASGARRVARARVAAISVPTGDGAVVIDAYDGPLAEATRGRVVPLPDAPLLQQVTATGRPIVIADAADDRTPAWLLREGLDLGPLMVIPLTAADQTLGALLIGNDRDRPPFTDTDVEMATSFAAHAALTLEFARAQADRQRLTVLEDRDRIARDLHDIVIQRLFAVGMRLQGVHSKLHDADTQRLSSSVDDLDRTIHDIRTSIFALRTPTTAQDDLRRQVLDITIQAAETLGFAPQLRLDGPLDLLVPEHIHPHVLATLTEALSNAGRHAYATAVDVLLHASPDHLTLQITDNGRGLDPQRHESGLDNLRRRATHLGGTMTTTPGPDGRGLTLTWRIPLTDAPPS